MSTIDHNNLRDYMESAGEPMKRETAEELYNSLEGGMTGQARQEIPLTPSITAKVLEPIPAGDNPFRHDLSNMGSTIGTNITVMFHNHQDQRGEYLIVVNTETGERVRLVFAEKSTKMECESNG